MGVEFAILRCIMPKSFLLPVAVACSVCGRRGKMDACEAEGSGRGNPRHLEADDIGNHTTDCVLTNTLTTMPLKVDPACLFCKIVKGEYTRLTD